MICFGSTYFNEHALLILKGGNTNGNNDEDTERDGDRQAVGN